MSPARIKLAGTILSAIFAGLAFAYPAHAAEFSTLAGSLFSALHIPRPGDVRASE